MLFCNLAFMGSASAIGAQGQSCSHLSQSSAFRKYSHGNQDGILSKIFKAIGVTNRVAVEFGFGYEGRSGNTGEQLIEKNSGLNTRLLRNTGWNVTYFDAIISDAKAGIRKVTLTEENIVEAFRDAGVPTEVDYVSIDVDSIDLWLLRALLQSQRPGSYSPRVISVEFNRNFLSWMHLTHVRNWHKWTQRSLYGASAGAINHVASANGYRVVNIMPSGLDMFFVRNDVLQAHCNEHSIDTFEGLAKSAGVGKRTHKTCDEQQDLSRLVDLELELQDKHEAAHRKAISEVTLLNQLHPHNPMCRITSMTWTNHSFGPGMDVATVDLARVTAELETTKVEEQQLGAALHARRKKKELREQLKKQEA
jgi:hypothetical protein